ncbi:uncharacterized protein [Aegilops tauschii subsp. strangulata]|uniref:Uncharacterized protein n=1 Tax=Aegilops tauschii subsp. strangulata TaxID=200361 RepID=A0A453LEW9_AEGTS|nr:uncharacterized protein LOC109774992 [Aegilops tauschii subsp. strangulata]XP_020189338.1 uncharacterized protein LOC109774992 [Aegilops tauschii subsp. strangulata]
MRRRLADQASPNPQLDEASSRRASSSWLLLHPTQARPGVLEGEGGHHRPGALHGQGGRVMDTTVPEHANILQALHRRASSSNSWGSCRISLSWVMESAAIMAIPLANGGGKRLDWQDFISIITLLVNKHLLRLPCQRRVRPPAPSSTRLRHT